MSGHFVKDIWLKPVEEEVVEGFESMSAWSQAQPRNMEVWINSKGTNDDCPFEMWHCESLTKVYRKEGLIGLSIEITDMINGGDAELYGKVEVSTDRLLKLMKKAREHGTYIPHRKPN
jgi:hypothetical protein